MGSDPDLALLKAAAAGDEPAFASLVDRHGAAMLRLARLHVPSDAVAQEVVQEAWIAVLRGADRFQGRSLVRTWLFSIAANRAKSIGRRERRSLPFAALDGGEPERPTERPEELPYVSYAGAETLSAARAAIATLPAMQRLVITMRDLQGWDSADVCNVLEVSETNQRVLLHRARQRVRSALEHHLVHVAA